MNENLAKMKKKSLLPEIIMQKPKQENFKYFTSNVGMLTLDCEKKTVIFHTYDLTLHQEEIYAFKSELQKCPETVLENLATIKSLGFKPVYL